MGVIFAKGKKAKGVCDICGLTFLLRQLKPMTYKGKKTGIKACPQDWNKEHPQERLAEALAARGADAEALRDPRPETNLDRALTGYTDYYSRLTSGPNANNAQLKELP
jgi:hypothetical protein